MNLENIGIKEIKQILDCAQESSACHTKYAIVMKKVLEKDNDGNLLEQFIESLYIILLADRNPKNIYVEKLTSFISTFCSTLKANHENDIVTDHPILLRLLTELLKCSKYAMESCRFWSCKLINKIFENVEEINDVLYEQIKEEMLQRLKDSKSAVRIQAIISLYRLQNPEDPRDPIMAELCNILSSDYNAKVRQLCIEKIAITKHVLPFILQRIRDTDVSVRLAAFRRLCPMARYLKVAQRRLILQCGSLDASDIVKKFISIELLESWLQIYNNNYLQLMESIRLDACEDDIKKTTTLVEFTLNTLFKTKSIKDIVATLQLNSQKMIEYEDLNWESALYYRVAVQFLRQSEEFDDALNLVLPDLIEFCKYIKGYCEFVENKIKFNMLQYQFTLLQFFLITEGYDVGDPASRKCLNSLAVYMLQNIELTVDTARQIIKNLERTIPNVNNLTTFVCEIISNIMYGEDAINENDLCKKEAERYQAISRLKSNINSLHEKERQCISEKRFQDAEEVKIELEDKQKELENFESMYNEIEETETERKMDVPTVIKYLNIVEALLLSPLIKNLNPALATLCSEVIQKVIIHDNDEVKAKALKCYALCCIIDKTSASYGIHIFSAPILSSHMMEACDPQILVVCIKTVVDLLIVYGLSLVDKADERKVSETQKTEQEERKVFIGGTSLADLVEGLADLLDYEDPQIEETATQGVCILLLHNRVTSPSLLSRIIVKWANPATDNEGLRQFIGFTLNCLVKLPSCSSYFADAVLSTIRTLILAPKTSSLVDVDVENIVKFMLTLCHMSPEGPLIHRDIAIKICSQMIDKPRLKVNSIFSKTLTLLTIPDDMEVLDDLVHLCDQLKDVFRDNQILKNITKFNSTVTQIRMKLTPAGEK